MRHILLVLLLLTGASALRGQWRVTVLSGTATTRGDARNDTDPSQPEFHAERPATFTIALARNAGRWRASAEGRHTSADLSEVSRSVAVTTLDAFEAWGAAFELGLRIAGRPRGPELRAGLALGVDRWSLDGAAARWRAGARGAVEADLPLVRRWSGVVRGEISASPSVFTAAELPEGFSRRVAWRTGIVLGVARQF